MDNVKDIYGQLMDRVQKLTSALYRVTDLLPDKEPLKWTLRDNAVGVYNSMVSIKVSKDKTGALNEAINSMHKTVKSLEVVSVGVCVSNLNFEILKREYLYAKNLLEGKKGDIVSDQKILPEFNVRSKKTGDKNKNITGTGRTLPESPNLALSETVHEIKGEVNQNTTRSLSPVSPFPQNRKDKIIDFLKDKEASAVGEIAAIFHGEASEKAIQRDLLDLVKSGKISAIGDKRWRKYETVDF